MVQQPRERVALHLIAQRLALTGRVVRERGHRGEALDQLDLLAGERVTVGHVAIDVQRPHDALARQQRHAHERLGVVRRAADDAAQRLHERVRHVARGAVGDHPSGHARPERDRVGQDLVDPVADREHRREQPRGIVDLVDRQIVVAQQRAQMVRDPAERAVERVRRQDAGSRVDQRFQRRSAFDLKGRGNGHVSLNRPDPGAP